MIARPKCNYNWSDFVTRTILKRPGVLYIDNAVVIEKHGPSAAAAHYIAVFWSAIVLKVTALLVYSSPGIFHKEY